MSQATLPERPYVNSNLFSGHYLDERVRGREEWECDDDAGDAMEELRSLYELEGSLVDRYGEDALVDNWIDEVLDVLGFGAQEEVTLPDGSGFVDELLFETTTARRDAAEVYLDTEDTTDLFERGVGIVEAKQWDAAFDVQFSEQRPYRNASHQTKHYLEKTPASIQWGVLTNGRKWRLYGTNDYETQTYYEVDLPELLERGDLEAFKYFYVFFRPEAFRESAGTRFLDEVWSESETASQELGENLQDNVFTALRVLGRGFIETNDHLDINPNDEEALDELKEQSLVLLYRLMFILYAEARGLIHPEGQRAQDDYEENFSLDALRLDIHEGIGEVDDGFAEEFSTYSTGMWSRLEDLFRLIDEGEEDLGIPPYNGGLFDHDEHDFLTEHEVSNRYLAEVIYRLSTTQNDEGRYVLADYADLDTRHLGSVYEGLLEHQFRIAPEQYAAVAAEGGQAWKPATEVSVTETVETVPEDGLYVVNDEGERKATGAYYTPDYVVTYIVEETVGPLVEEIREDLVDQGFEPGTQEYIGPFFRRVTDLQILDPAMGSGHFLTKATGYLSEQVMSEVREAEEEFGVAFDEQHIRREIAKECIYGVDLNGMAVELAKLSMWLETLAADRPLAFLDHHFKQGNSLVGSDIEEIEELESDANGDGDQYSLAEFGATREGTIERLMDIYSEFLAIENETVEDVQEMKRKYAEIEQDELRRRLVAMANVHTAEQFGVNVPGGGYERMAKALEDGEEWANVKNADWFETAQVLAAEQDFFHWKLAFPEAFYEVDGKTMENSGFDAVVGNPPWVATAGRGSISASMNSDVREYLESTLSATRQQFDLYVAFYEKFVRLSSSEHTGIVVPDAILAREQNKHIRGFLLREGHIRHIVDIGMAFRGVENGAVILITDDQGSDVLCADIKSSSLISDISYNHIPQDVFHDQDAKRFLIYLNDDIRSVLNKIERHPELGNQIEISRGEEIGKKSDILSDSDGENLRQIVPGGRINRYGLNYSEIRYIHNRQIKKSQSNYRSPKLIFRQTSASLVGTIDHESRITIKSAYNIRAKGGKGGLKNKLAVLNSNVLNFYHYIKHAAYRSVFPQINQSTFEALPVPNNKNLPDLTDQVDKRISLTKQSDSVNTDLLDYIQPYSEGPAVTDTATYQPPGGVGDTKLTATKEDYENLRMGTVICEREDESTVVVHATARYKPDDPDAHETDRWGYTETEPMPAMRLTDLSETEADLVEAFIPVAVEEAGGFAGFRETATKTNSLVDRLEAITLPDPDDVADDLQRYREAVERAEELDEKIQRTDDLIDEIVYELYGLTDEEIELVEQAVGD